MKQALITVYSLLTIGCASQAPYIQTATSIPEDSFAPLVQANVDQDTELEYVRATYKKDGSTSIDFIDTISGELETVTLAHFTSRCEVAFKDVNEDGNLDIVVATPESKKVLLGDGTGKFIKQF